MRKWWSLSLGHLKLFYSPNVWPATKLSPAHTCILTMPMVALFCVYGDKVQILGAGSVPWLSFQVALTGLTFSVRALSFPCASWPNVGRNNEIWRGLFLTTLVTLNKFLWPDFKQAADFKVHYLPTHKWNRRVISCHTQNHLSSTRKIQTSVWCFLTLSWLMLFTSVAGFLFASLFVFTWSRRKISDQRGDTWGVIISIVISHYLERKWHGYPVLMAWGSN